MTIKVLLIGVGQIGLKYDFKSNYNLTHFNSFYKNSKFKIIGVCDVDLKKKNFFNKKNISFFLNYQEAIKKLNPTVVVISTPTPTHFKILTNVLKHNSVKLILCEKPFGLNIKQAKKIKFLDKFNKIYINYMRSTDDVFYSKVIKKIRNDSNLFIKIFYKGSLSNNACHYIQLLNQYFGECKKIKNVSNFNVDFSDFTLIFKKNIQAHFFSSSARGLFMDSLTIYTPKSIINYDNGGHLIYNFKNIKNPVYLTQNYFELKNIIKNKFYENPQKYIVKNVYKCLLKKTNYLCDVTEAINVHKIIKKIKNKK